MDKTSLKNHHQIRVGLAGPSGSGKTTITKWIQEEIGLPFISGSATHMLSDQAKLRLEKVLGNTWNGHREVIINSAKNIEFGQAFQLELLKLRHEKLKLAAQQFGGYITDRSAYDNLVYFLLQCSYAWDYEFSELFWQECMRMLQDHYDLIIFVPTLNPKGQIEDNLSRVPNWHFQMTVSSVFSDVINRSISPDNSYNTPDVVRITSWDLETRKEEVINAIQSAIAR